MELREKKVNVILVIKQNDVLIPVVISWKHWVGHYGGRKILIVPVKGIRIRKVKKSNGTRERRSFAKSKQRQSDQPDWYQDFKTGPDSYRSPLQQYKYYQTQLSKSQLFAAPIKQSSALPKRARPMDTSDSTKARPAQQVGTTGGPSSSNEPKKTQPSQKIGTTDSSSSKEPTKTQPSKVGATGSSSGPKKMKPGQRGETTGDASSSSGSAKKQPEQKVGPTVSKPTTSEPTESKPEFSLFEKECLDEHNKLRAIHGAPPLTLDRNLCNYAQEWANHLATIGQMEHRTEGTYGENLFMSSGLKVDSRMPVKSWYDEIQFYKYGSDFTPSTGHFTQVVWKNSKEMGCAFAQKGNEIYVVANYNPPGNVQGKFSENVLPPKS